MESKRVVVNSRRDLVCGIVKTQHTLGGERGMERDYRIDSFIYASIHYSITQICSMSVSFINRPAGVEALKVRVIN